METTYHERSDETLDVMRFGKLGQDRIVFNYRKVEFSTHSKQSPNFQMLLVSGKLT
jgi:hypothetical protein